MIHLLFFPHYYGKVFFAHKLTDFQKGVPNSCIVFLTPLPAWCPSLYDLSLFAFRKYFLIVVGLTESRANIRSLCKVKLVYFLL